MKIFYALILVFVSCTATKLTFIPTETTYYKIDFAKYTNSGFLITPEKYIGNYESIGIVTYVVVPGAEYKVIDKIKYEDGSTRTIEKWVVYQITLSQGIDSLYSLAIDMGADAIINFSATTTQRNYQSIANPVTLEGYELSGYAIRRKD